MRFRIGVLLTGGDVVAAGAAGADVDQAAVIRRRPYAGLPSRRYDRWRSCRRW